MLCQRLLAASTTSKSLSSLCHDEQALINVHHRTPFPVKAELHDLQPLFWGPSFTTPRSPQWKACHAHSGSPASTVGLFVSSTLSPPPSPTIPTKSTGDTSSSPAKKRAPPHEAPSVPLRAPEVPSAPGPSIAVDNIEDPPHNYRRITQSASHSLLQNKGSTLEGPSLSRSASARTIQTDCDISVARHP